MRIKITQSPITAMLTALVLSTGCGTEANNQNFDSTQDALMALARSDRDPSDENDERPGFGVDAFTREFNEQGDGDDQRFPRREFEETRNADDDENDREVRERRSEIDEAERRARRPGEGGETRSEREDVDAIACLSGRLEGRWITPEERDGGTFGGRWVSRRGRFVGHVFGRFKINESGEQVFRAKIIRRDGEFVGKVRGLWNPINDQARPEPARARTNRTETDAETQDPAERRASRDSETDSRPERSGAESETRPQARPSPDGFFMGRWELKNGRSGTLRGGYIKGETERRGHMMGHWMETCGESDERPERGEEIQNRESGESGERGEEN